MLALIALGAGCEEPFEPFQESRDGAFSMAGYLNVKADTQWVRVMPVRQNLFLQPEPIDAVVTLEHQASGRTVTLNDSLFTYQDAQLDGVAYAHNFWTTEPLEPEATYRLRAVRSDGASATATVVLPPDPEIAFITGPGIGSETARLSVRAPKLLFVEVSFAMSDTAGRRAPTIVIPGEGDYPTNVPDVRDVVVRGGPLILEGLRDMGRQEIRIAVAPSDWPYDADLPDVAVMLPGAAPSNVDNGLGYVAGVAAWTIPFHRCVVIRAGRGEESVCTTTINEKSASIEGRLIGEPCRDPGSLVHVSLRETFTDGREYARSWRSGWDGSYRFEGIEPGAELLLTVGPEAPALRLPVLGPGERFVIDDIGVPCRAAG